MANIPNDPVMLLSFVNLKLRDFYNNLDDMCNELGVNREDIVSKLESIDYKYDEARNQFV